MENANNVGKTSELLSWPHHRFRLSYLPTKSALLWCTDCKTWGKLFIIIPLHDWIIITGDKPGYFLLKSILLLPFLGKVKIFYGKFIHSIRCNDRFPITTVWWRPWFVSIHRISEIFVRFLGGFFFF